MSRTESEHDRSILDAPPGISPRDPHNYPPLPTNPNQKNKAAEAALLLLFSSLFELFPVPGLVAVSEDFIVFA
jgi:hypothetical protein